MGVGKELAGQGNHTFHQVGIDDAFADFAFVVGLAVHGAVGKQQCHFAVGREVINHVLKPSEVGVAFGRCAVCPTWIIGKGFAPPIADVEWWVCHNEIHLFVDVLRLGETVGVVFAKVVINAANRHIHGGEFPSGGVEFAHYLRRYRITLCNSEHCLLDAFCYFLLRSRETLRCCIWHYYFSLHHKHCCCLYFNHKGIIPYFE
ncbi:hypothetical protein HAINFHK1212_0363 [Haemophilus influenzae HK1212]|uniref:Uncharacterized protein n=1 Tax=Haemophilus influenzae HK1212 TaxID=456482 RepID=A0A7G2JZI1_HAEIF|nr:hypothetical protein HAINFHK1212_0363 [Haemophilus influenzae HK1212]